MLRLNTLSGGPRKGRKRVGRGSGSGLGKTSGRGSKGQKARSGYKRRPWFQGGQMPLQRRVPKRGFRPYGQVKLQEVNVRDLARFQADSEVGPEQMANAGLIHSARMPVKVLGEGDLGVALKVTANAFSGSARAKIEGAGGTVRLTSNVEEPSVA
jgi:large subunit ribosomal protein L15